MRLIKRMTLLAPSEDPAFVQQRGIRETPDRPTVRPHGAFETTASELLDRIKSREVQSLAVESDWPHWKSAGNARVRSLAADSWPASLQLGVDAVVPVPQGMPVVRAQLDCATRGPIVQRACDN